MAEQYNPGDHTVAEVKEYVEENPAQASEVLEAEKAGQNRTTLVSHLEALVEGQADVPQAAEAAPVVVAPAPTPTKQDTILGKNYTVSADRGYRVSQ
jgi:hypothetical protein